MAEGDDERRRGRRAHVDPRAVGLAVDHVVRDGDHRAVDGRVDVGSRDGSDREHLGAGATLELVPDRALPVRARDAPPQTRQQPLVGLTPDRVELHRARVAPVESDRRHGLAGDRQPDLEVAHRRQDLGLGRHARGDRGEIDGRRDPLGRARAEGGQQQGDESENGDDPDHGQTAGAVLRAPAPVAVPGRSPGARRGHRDHGSGRPAALNGIRPRAALLSGRIARLRSPA